VSGLVFGMGGFGVFQANVDYAVWRRFMVRMTLYCYERTRPYKSGDLALLTR
jgi:hypothetical protein